MRDYGRLISPHLPHQQRLKEAPRCHERVQVTHRLPQLERPQHIAIDVDVARQIRISELDLIKAGDGTHGVPILQRDTEVRHTLSEASDCTIRKMHLERHACRAKCSCDAIEPKPAACGRRRVRSAALLPDSDFLGHATASLWLIPSRLAGTLPA